LSAIGASGPGVAAAAELPPAARQPLRHLLLTLADNKRILGIRFADAMLGSPSLESGIAAASMAQDEWGHSRLTYALLADFGDDPRTLEHTRDAGAYHVMEVLDEPLGAYPAVVAAALVVDGALRHQYGALVGSRYGPIRNRVQKLLDEEVLHEEFASGWVRRLAQSRMRQEILMHLQRMIPTALRWFGPAEDPEQTLLLADGVVSQGSEELRSDLLARLGPVLEHAGLAEALGLTLSGERWRYLHELDWTTWDPVRRRGAPGGPDPDTIARVRGDRNRIMLVD
jgi:ring-1,2-phenylacetyl-CoA epoxidase subunit PaaC